MKSWYDIYWALLKRGLDYVWAEQGADQYMKRNGYTQCKCGRFYKSQCEHCAKAKESDG